MGHGRGTRRFSPRLSFRDSSRGGEGVARGKGRQNSTGFRCDGGRGWNAGSIGATGIRRILERGMCGKNGGVRAQVEGGAVQRIPGGSCLLAGGVPLGDGGFFSGDTHLAGNGCTTGGGRSRGEGRLVNKTEAQRPFDAERREGTPQCGGTLPCSRDEETREDCFGGAGTLQFHEGGHALIAHESGGRLRGKDHAHAIHRPLIGREVGGKQADQVLIQSRQRTGCRGGGRHGRGFCAVLHDATVSHDGYDSDRRLPHE